MNLIIDDVTTGCPASSRNVFDSIYGWVAPVLDLNLSLVVRVLQYFAN